MRRIWDWVCSRFSDQVTEMDQELQQQAQKVENLEAKAEAQDRRLSVVEAKVGVRDPARWPRRDRG